MKKIKAYIASLSVALVAVVFVGFSVSPHAVSATSESASSWVLEEDCGEQDIKEIIKGKSRGWFGCWGANTTCKVKCAPSPE